MTNSSSLNLSELSSSNAELFKNNQGGVSVRYAWKAIEIKFSKCIKGSKQLKAANFISVKVAANSLQQLKMLCCEVAVLKSAANPNIDKAISLLINYEAS